MADPGSGDGPGTLTLHQAAALVGTYRWTEERLFALTGRWSGEAAMSPVVQVHFFEASRRHARHAEEWAERLPVVAGIDPLELTRPAGAAGPLLAALEAEEAAAARVTGWCRIVLPALATTYRRHLARAVPVADNPVIRVLRAVLADVHEDVEAGEGLLRDLVPADDGGASETGLAAGAAAGATRRLEKILAAEGAEGCLLAWPGAPRPGSAVPEHPGGLAHQPG